MDVSIIIVNWNSKDYLRNCIASILATTTGIEYEIVVIDNASFDGYGEILQQYDQHVQSIQSDKNIGFAKANNAAFEISKGRNILFLNPDTEIEEEAIFKLLMHLESIPDAGVVGAKLLNSDRSIQTSCIRTFPTILNQVLDAEALRKCFPRSRLWGMAPLFDQHRKPVKVDAVSGACLMIKRSVFETVGRFSTDYFMYSEDIDLCLKVREAGWKTYYVPTAIVLHYSGMSSSQNSIDFFSIVMMLESRWRLFRKTRPLWYCWLYRLGMFSSSVIRFVIALLMWPALRVRGKAPSLGLAVRKWKACLRWTVGLENWVKNY